MEICACRECPCETQQVAQSFFICAPCLAGAHGKVRCECLECECRELIEFGRVCFFCLRGKHQANLAN